MKTPRPTFTPGDRVAFASSFLRAVSGDFEMSMRRGTVTRVVGTLITVAWDGFDSEARALAINLRKADRVHAEAV